MIYAHGANTNGDRHPLAQYISGVAKLAALATKFAEKCSPALIEAAHWARLLHDLGKYREILAGRER